MSRQYVNSCFLSIFQFMVKHTVYWRLMVCILVFVLDGNDYIYAQSSQFVLNAGIGVEQLKNDMIIPYGMQGRTVILGVAYNFGKEELPRYHCQLEVQQSTLNSPWFTADKLYTHWQGHLAFGRRWYSVDNTNTQLAIGVEGAITGEFNNPSAYNESISVNPAVYGFYDIGIRNFLHYQLTFRNISLINMLNYHLLGFGYYPKPPFMNLNVSESNTIYYTRPNTISHPFNRLHVKNKAGIEFNIGNRPVQLFYGLEYQRQSAFVYRQISIQHSFILALVL